MLKATEVAYQLGCSAECLRVWYKWKEKNPEHILAKTLPDYVTINNVRMWKEEDLAKLYNFKNTIKDRKLGLGIYKYR